MKKSNDMELIWVSSSFKKALKIEAAKSDKSVLQLTRELSNRELNIDKLSDDARRKKFDFF